MSGPRQDLTPRGLTGIFLHHPNAANLLMVLMILFGVFSLARINTQFFPTIETGNVGVSIGWSGASAEDVERNILAIAEPPLRYLDGVKKMTSYAREGSGSIQLEFKEGTDMQKAIGDVESAVKAIGNLPEDSDDPKVSTSQWFDRVASMSIGGNVPEPQLRAWAKKIRDELVDRGIAKVSFTGMRDPELQVIVPERNLRQVGLTVADLSRVVTANGRDLPSGNLDGDVERQLRAISNVESARALGQLEVKSLPTGEKIRLSDIADVREGFEQGAIEGFSNQKRAIELDISSSAGADTLTTNQILTDYLAELRPKLPANLEVQVYEVRADALSARIMLLVKNGLSGLLLVVVILFIFLNTRIALWVAAGIPVALLATIGLMFIFGESINMISLFALIMMLGIIVDDAIVVGEHTDTRMKMGDDAMTAAENGVGQMFVPVTAAVTTTVATFAPIMLVTGTVGQIMGVLPIVVIAVALASLVECFFILPGHLAHALAGRTMPRFSWWRMFFIALVLALFIAAFLTRGGGEGALAAMLPLFAKVEAFRAAQPPFLFATIVSVVTMAVAAAIEGLIFALRRFSARNAHEGDVPEDGWFRRGFDKGFNWFRNGPFSWLVDLSYRWRYVTISVAVGLVMVFAVGLIKGDHVGFVFFPSPEAENISGNLVFHPGTPQDVASAAIADYEAALRRVEAELGKGEPVIDATFTTLGSTGRSQGDNLARIKVQLKISEERSVRTADFVRAWQAEAPNLPSVRRFSVRQARGGPSGADIEVQLRGSSIGVLKDAATEVSRIVAAIPGVSGVEDDLPYGKPELVMELTPRGAALGFTLQDIGTQVRNAFEGAVPRRFARGDDEVAIRITHVMEQQGTAALRAMQLRSPSGNAVPLGEIVTMREQQGFSAIQRLEGKTTISVSGEIDAAVNTTDGVVERLTQSGALDAVARTYGVTYKFGGRSQEQGEAFKDLQVGTLVALMVVYIILAWVFGSYFKPLAVMLIIPFGIVGAVFGHWILGYQLTVLSLIGLLGLAGILVNDSIILVSRFDERQKELGEDIHHASVGASRDRLRAVLLTSLTTIGGLVPLLFETSQQAQFLMPMAVTMVFGLATATLLVLFLVPAFIGVGNDIRSALVAIYGHRQTMPKAPRPLAGE